MFVNAHITKLTNSYLLRIGNDTLAIREPEELMEAVKRIFTLLSKDKIKDMEIGDNQLILTFGIDEAKLFATRSNNDMLVNILSSLVDRNGEDNGQSDNKTPNSEISKKILDNLKEIGKGRTGDLNQEDDDNLDSATIESLEKMAKNGFVKTEKKGKVTNNNHNGNNRKGNRHF